MKTETSASAELLRVYRAQFEREFGRVESGNRWLTLYVILRESGDLHITACETIRAEIQMEEMTK